MSRKDKMNGYIGNFQSSFLSCEKDTEAIIKKLFVDSNPYSEDLKRLIVINTPDCLTNRTNQTYIDTLKKYKLPTALREDGYLRLEPRMALTEHEDVMTYIIISFDNFSPNVINPYYRDCLVQIDIICHPKYWDVGSFRLRPTMIAGYIDGILNGARLSGIGTLQFMGANMIIMSDDLMGYTLTYSATHGVDDSLPVEDD